MLQARRSILSCALAAIMAAGSMLHAQSQPSEFGEGRIVKFFDFDERKLGNPEDLPMYWTKVQDEKRPGLPHYVNGKLDGEVGRSSPYSFRFDLNGGSLIYKFDPAVGGKIPVKKNARYRIQGYVKTTALENAKARISGYFVDQDLNPIKGSVRHSAVYSGSGLSKEWALLTVDLRCDNAKAAFLIIELGLLQPALYAPSSLGARTLFNQDVQGSAWFTDVAVSQVPEVALNTEVPGNIFPRGKPVRLWLKITDREASDLTMRLEVANGAGSLVHQRTGEMQLTTSESGLEHSLMVEIPELPTGWYQARISLASKGRVVASETQNFVQLADDGRLVSPDPRFGAIATDLSPAQWSLLPTLLPQLGTGRVKVTVWSENVDIQKTDNEAFDRLLERLQDGGIIPTACIVALPPEISEVAGSTSVARLPRIDPKHWKPRLSYLIARHANHLDRWQLGLDGQDLFATDANYRAAYNTVYKAFEGLVNTPDVAIPWPGTFEADRQLPSTVAIALPATVLPDQVPLYVQDTKDRGGQRLSLTLLPLGPAYGRDANISDLAQRVITALTAGTERLDIPLPFTPDGQPDESFLVLRTLNRTLSGALYKGKLRLAEHVEAYLFEQGGRGIVVLWKKEGAAAVGLDPTFDNSFVRINLGGKPVLVDLFGNTSTLYPAPAVPSSNPDGPEPGSVRVELGDPRKGIPSYPVIVDGIDPAMALFRVSVAFDNPLLESSFTPHSRKITFTNTFNDFISGVVRLEPPKGWSIVPNNFQFNLNPGETFTRDVSLEIPYNTLAGPKPVMVKFETANTKPSKFSIPLEMRLGLNEVGMQTLALHEGNDIVVQLLITNYGQKKINYAAFALFPGQARQERLVADLGPGKSTLRRFRFPSAHTDPNKPNPNSGKKIRVGLREVEGTRILNDEIVIP